MTTFVLDSSAVLRFIDREAGWSRVAEIFAAHLSQSAEIAISAIQWGEIAGRMRKRQGVSGQKIVLEELAYIQPRIVAATGDRAIHAAEIKVDYKIAYADAFALDLAMDSPDHVLVTADYDFKSVTSLARIEFLPAK